MASEKYSGRVTPAEIEAHTILQAAGWITPASGNQSIREAAELIILLAKKIETQRMVEIMRKM